MAEKPVTYIRVPKRMLVAIIAINIFQFVFTIASFQYTNYVDRQSNGAWCDIVKLFNTAYKETPPTTIVGQKIATEMSKLPKKFSC